MSKEPNGKNQDTEPETMQETVMGRRTLDELLDAGVDVPPAAIMNILSGNNPPTGEVRLRYARQLFDHALNDRDSAAILLLTHLMDDDLALDEALYGHLSGMLDSAPDAVYAFVRVRVAEDLRERWVTRLQIAAVRALQVAIGDGDTETVRNWLTLISREPVSYGLGKILNEGILAARQRAMQDADLARLLLSLAAKRAPTVMDDLLKDAEFVNNLPAMLGSVFRDQQGDALILLERYGTELFVIALAHATEQRGTQIITPPCIEQIWKLRSDEDLANLPEHYQPQHIIDGWLTSTNLSWMSDASIHKLMTLLLNAEHDDTVNAFIERLAQRDNLTNVVAIALHESGRKMDDAITLVGQIVNKENLSLQQSVEIYVMLLDIREWDETTLPLVQQLERTLQYNPSVVVEPETMWRMMDIAEDAKDESIAKVVTRRFTASLEAIEDEATLLNHLQRLNEHVHWNATARQTLTTWWRNFARSSSIARLQRLDKALDGIRTLDEFRSAVQTVIAFRKMLGKRTLSQFAADLTTTYAILQSLAESFDPSAKRTVSFDPVTVRAELDDHTEGITPHELKILANNFKELAELIGEMGDQRTKATLMRRGDDIDRHLMSGDTQPHSAVDVMKWLAGYLNGSQNNVDESDD